MATPVPETAITLELKVWYHEPNRSIRLATSDGRPVSMISSDRTSGRYHAALYRKLAWALQDAGAPAPPIRRSRD